MALAPLLLCAALACTGRGGARFAPPPGVLAHRVPDPNPATYLFADTTRFVIQAGPLGRIEVEAAHAGIAELDYRQHEHGLDVLVTITWYDGRFENPGQGGARATASDIGGPLGIRLGHRGEVEVTDTPSLAPAVLDIAGPESLVRPFFALLPGTPAEPGTVWVDTVTVVEESAEIVTRSVSVVTSTLVGDTVVDGRALLVIETAGTREIEAAGTTGGVQVRQRVTGRTRGRVLWDPRLDAMAARTEVGAFTGALEMPGVGAGGLPVEATHVRVVRLLD